MARSVLLVSDQAAGRTPDRCVLSGVRTERAVRATAVPWTRAPWLLGFPGLVPMLGLLRRSDRVRVALPVAPEVWRGWQRRNLLAFAVIAAGLAFVVVGMLRGDGGIAVLGAVPLVAAAAYRLRAARNYWVTCILDAERGTVAVSPTHAAFDEQARGLFARSLHRR